MIDEANDPSATQLRPVCHDTLPWLIFFSLDAFPANTRMDTVAEVAHRHYSNCAHRALRRRNLLL
jgi:hypothetical protein